MQLSIDFHFVDKTSSKRSQIFKCSRNESQRVELDKKRELKKSNEILTKITVTATASNVTIRLIKARGENNGFS